MRNAKSQKELSGLSEVATLFTLLEECLRRLSAMKHLGDFTDKTCNSDIKPPLPVVDAERFYRSGENCKYHIVIAPKYRKRKLYGKFKRHVGDIIKDLCLQRGVELLEGNLRADHVHMCLSVPPKFSIAFVIRFLKGKSAVRIHRYLLKNKQTKGKHFWSRGYCVSTVGLDEETIRKYILDQEKAEKQIKFDFE